MKTGETERPFGCADTGIGDDNERAGNVFGRCVWANFDDLDGNQKTIEKNKGGFYCYWKNYFKVVFVQIEKIINL